MKKRPKSPAPLAAESEPIDRIAWVLPAALFVGFFYYPEKAWPIENLGFCAVMALAAVASGIGCCWAGGRWREQWLARIGRVPIIAGAALSLWALARWSTMDVRSFGTEWVFALLWMTVAMAAGVAAVAVSDAARDGGSNDLLKFFRRFLIVAAIATALHAFYQYFIGWDRSLSLISKTGTAGYGGFLNEGVLHALREKRVSGRLGNPNLFAAQLSMLAVFCIGSLSRGETKRWRIAGALGWIALATALVLTGSRGGMLTFAVVTVLGVAAIGNSWRGSRVISGAAVFVLFCIMIAPACAGVLERIGNITTVRERLFYWAIAAKIWAMHPIVGGGPGRFALLYAGLKSPMARESQYAHSWVMQSGADLGAIGVLLQCLFWGGLAWMGWRVFVNGRRGRRPHSFQSHIPEQFWPLLALVALGFNGLFEFTVQWRAFLVPAGLLVGLACHKRDEAYGSYKSHKSYGGFIATGLTTAALIAAAALSPAWHLALRYQWLGQELADDPQASVEAFATASGYQPRDASIVLNQARATIALGRNEEAASLLEKAAKLNPYSAAVRATQARLLINQNQLAPALGKIDEALNLYPSNLEYRMIKIGLLVRLGRDAEARDLLESIERDRLPMYSEDRATLDDMRVKLGLQPVGPPKSSS